ncbi:MAG: hypothetical protein ACT4N2_03465 [Hyphomicrobium sp.]
MTRFGMALTLAVTLTAGAAGSHAGCRTVAGSADMVTTDLAKFMANAALKNAIAAHGLKPSGAISMKCREDTFTTYCKATRQACS